MQHRLIKRFGILHESFGHVNIIHIYIYNDDILAQKEGMNDQHPEFLGTYTWHHNT